MASDILQRVALLKGNGVTTWTLTAVGCEEGMGNELCMSLPDTGDECKEPIIECEQSVAHLLQNCEPNTNLSTAMCALFVGSKLKIAC